MKKKSCSQWVLVRGVTILVFAICAAPAVAQTRSESFSRTLSFADRVAYQYAIEEVYWRHRTWPKENSNPKPSLDQVMPRQQIEKKVADYLRNSQALEDYWRRPITAEQLQAEMERMAQHTKQPDVLREVFEALGNDPFVLAECLARPALAQRLLTNWYPYDQRIHGKLKQHAEADLRTHSTIGRMKQLSGKYNEIELIKSDNSEKEKNHGAEHDVELNSGEWKESVEKLAKDFGFGVRSRLRGVAAFESADMSAHSKNGAADEYETLPIGKPSRLQEDETSYYATAVIEKSQDRLKLARVTWFKEPVESWLARAEDQLPSTTIAPTARYTLPKISDAPGGCADNTWTATPGAPDGRQNHTAVWTGSEMIVWGGFPGYGPCLNTGGRYNPATDTWTATSALGAPGARLAHTAVWTGSEMVVWGGRDFVDYIGAHYLNTGGRYNPVTDTWVTTSVVGAPIGRSEHAAVWTGKEMIVWGGYNYSVYHLNTGGKYNPVEDIWTPTSTTNAPSARAEHTAVWTGSTMIVWGGYPYTTSGGRYNPVNDSWTATSMINAPVARDQHTAVWSGSEMIVWGGVDQTSDDTNTGGKYNPSTDSWIATSLTNASSPRDSHTAVWTGNEMIIWGGSSLNTGGRYNPGTDSWLATNIINAPAPRSAHTAVWTGSEMVIWGGSGLNTGGRYNPDTDSWTNTGADNVPSERSGHTAVWTGTEMIVWGGEGFSSLLNTGGRYNPITDSWTATSTTNAPSARVSYSAVWTGNEMIVWGGNSWTTELNTGGRYNPATDTWIGTSTVNAPTARQNHTAVWTGSEMIVWGGYGCGGNCLSYSGARYNPGTDSWTPTSTINLPPARWDHTAVWTGSEMIVWGGTDAIPNHLPLHTGGRYNPVTDSWTPTSLVNAPLGRYAHTTVWSGSEMIVWGGVDETFNVTNTGGRYNPVNDSWGATSLTSAPSSRADQTGVWTDSEMIIWGGDGVSPSGGRYDPSTNSWIATTTTNAPIARDSHTAVWTGTEMIVWGGGFGGFGYLNSGGIYCAQPSTPVAQSVVSRKTHDFAGVYDIVLPLSGTPGVECRNGGATNDYTLIVTFNANVSVNGNPQAAVTSGTGTIGSGGVSNGGTVTIAGNVVTIPLTNVANAQTIQVTLYGVNGSTNITIPMSILIGDTNGNRTVNASDLTQTKSRIGQQLNGTNFRSDVTANGFVDSVDIALLKSKIGTGLH